MGREGKKQVNVWVSEEAFENLRAFADEHGITVTALLEALGRSLPPARTPRWLAEVIAEARRVDAERRRR